MFIVTEFCENGDLEQYSKRHKSKLSENQIRQYLKDLASGLEALGKVNVAHRDIKPANLLIGNDGKLKIADFGAAIVLQRTTMLGIVQVSDGTSTEYQVGSALYRVSRRFLNNQRRSDTFRLLNYGYRPRTRQPWIYGALVLHSISCSRPKHLSNRPQPFRKRNIDCMWSNVCSTTPLIIRQ